MTDYAHPDRPEERLSTAEREAAVDRLSSAQLAGRITPQEFGARSTAARAAVTRGDLVPLFADLPPSEAGDAGAPAPAYGATAYPAAATPERETEYGGGPGVRPLGGAVGATIMALVPFVALALFFLTGFNGGWAWAWVWFALIPIAGIILYGPGATRRDRRR